MDRFDEKRALGIFAQLGWRDADPAPLAAWAAQLRANKEAQRPHGVVVDETGEIIATAHANKRAGVYLDEKDADRLGCGVNELGIALSRLPRLIGRQVAYVRPADLSGRWMAQDEPDAIRLRIIRSGLGVSRGWLADHLPSPRGGTVAERTVARWEDGATAVPEGLWDDLRALMDTHTSHVAHGVPDGPEWPEGWRRSVAMRNVWGDHETVYQNWSNR